MTHDPTLEAAVCVNLDLVCPGKGWKNEGGMENDTGDEAVVGPHAFFSLFYSR